MLSATFFALHSASCRFQGIAAVLNQEPGSTEEMDALAKYIGSVVEQVCLRCAACCCC